jgi:hypothetical protein
MSDKPDDHDPQFSPDDTLIVPPPNYRERILAAQKARTSEIRQSVEIPNPLLKKSDEAQTTPDNPAQAEKPTPSTLDGKVP